MKDATIVALCLLPAIAFAEEALKPDLSGTWEFNPTKSRLEMRTPATGPASLLAQAAEEG